MPSPAFPDAALTLFSAFLVAAEPKSPPAPSVPPAALARRPARRCAIVSSLLNDRARAVRPARQFPPAKPARRGQARRYSYCRRAGHIGTRASRYDGHWQAEVWVARVGGLARAAGEASDTGV